MATSDLVQVTSSSQQAVDSLLIPAVGNRLQSTMIQSTSSSAVAAPLAGSKRKFSSSNYIGDSGAVSTAQVPPVTAEQQSLNNINNNINNGNNNGGNNRITSHIAAYLEGVFGQYDECMPPEWVLMTLRDNLSIDLSVFSHIFAMMNIYIKFL